MSLVTDLDYLIHRLKISQLRVEDRIAGRTIRFDAELVSKNDYIKTTSTSYPEMRYCSSPDIIPGLPDGPLLAYRQFNSSSTAALSSGRGGRPPLNTSNSSGAIERRTQPQQQVASTSLLIRQPVAANRVAGGLNQTRQFAADDRPLKTVEDLTERSVIEGLTQQATSPSTSVSTTNTSTPPLQYNILDNSIITATPQNFSSEQSIIRKDDQRQPHHQRILSTIPETANNNIKEKISSSPAIDSDGDDEDIDLDYDDVKKETKHLGNAAGKYIIGRPNPEKQGETDGLTPNRPNPLPRKFSQANPPLTNSPLALMIPGVIYPKSRMRSLSSSSLNQASGSSSRQLLAPGINPLQETNPRNSPLPVPPPTTSEIATTPTDLIKGPRAPGKSLLTAMIEAKKPVMDNPFLGEFAGVTGRGELAPLALQIYLPHSDQPTKPLAFSVKREATVESVIGFALYTYYDQHIQPQLTPQQSRTAQWTMRIVEDDGSIDEDFPALERTRQIEKFAFDQFALCEVSPAQAKANELAKPQASTNSVNSLPPAPRPPPTNVVVTGGRKDSSPAIDPNSTKHSEGGGALQMIKIQLFNQVGVSHTTTLNVKGSTTLIAIKAAVCRKWNLNFEDYELTSTQARHALDRNSTLDGLLGITELSLVRRSAWGDNPAMMSRTPPPPPTTATTNSLVTTPYTPAGLPFIYRHYTVYRRMPMFVNKQERVLAIDGYYVHLLPPAGRPMGGGGGMGTSLGTYASTKTSSYHIGSLELCRQGRKVRRRLKLVFLRSHDTKTYDFEAANQEEADEISTNLNFLLHTYRGEKLSLVPLPSN